MSAPQSRIAQLSSTIAHHTHLIDAYLADHNLPYPSFDAAAPVELGLPSDLEASRNIVLSATQELNDLLQGPRALLSNHQHHDLVPLHLISRFDVANKVPVDGEIPFSELAKEVGVSEGPLKQVLRMGIAQRIFTEPRPGILVHSSASKLIREDEAIAAWVETRVEDMWPSATQMVDALVKWPGAGEPNQTGYTLAHAGQSFYEVLSRDSKKAKAFSQAMKLITTGLGFELHHIIFGFPWSSLPSRSTIVDVGGSTGSTALALARHFNPCKQFTFIVQDLPKSLESLSNEDIKAARDLGVQFMAHDFFREQPVRGADVYFLRWCLHNWPDSYCLRILRSLIPALKPGSRVLVMEIVMPEPGTVDNEMDRKLRAMDLTMLEIGNAREKDVGEWRELFERADRRFVWRGVVKPEGSRLAVLEWVWEGGEESRGG